MRNLLTLLLVVFTTGAVLAAPPSYQGKPLDFWVGQLASKEAGELQKAVEALAEMGESSPAARKAMLEGAVHDGYLAPMAPLAAGLTSAYGRFGEAGVPQVIEALEHKDPRVRQAAATSIGSLGEKSAGAVPALVEQMQAGDEAIISTGVNSLKFVGAAAAAPATEFLIARLDAEKPYARRQAAEVLARIGPAAKAAQEKLLRDITHADSGYRKAVVEALLAVTEGGARVEAALLTALDDKDDRVIVAALEGMRQVTPENRPRAVARLEALLAHDGYAVAPKAALALWRLTGEAAKPLATLAKELDSEFGQATAAEALGEMGPAAAPVVAKLAGLLDHKQGYVRSAAAEALGKIGPAAKRVAPALLARAKDESGYITFEMARALWRLEQNPAVVTPLLVRNLDTRYRDAQVQTLQLLAEIGPAAAAEAKSKVQSLLESEHEQVRAAAAETLQAISAQP